MCSVPTSFLPMIHSTNPSVQTGGPFESENCKPGCSGPRGKECRAEEGRTFLQVWISVISRSLWFIIACHHVQKKWCIEIRYMSFLRLGGWWFQPHEKYARHWAPSSLVENKNCLKPPTRLLIMKYGELFKHP